MEIDTTAVHTFGVKASETTRDIWTEFIKGKNLLSPPLAGPVPSEAKTSCKSCKRIRKRVPSILCFDAKP